MSTRLPTLAQLDAMLHQLQAYARDWAERECTSFDDAVLQRPRAGAQGGTSIWDMPAIDSKRAVTLLVELEGIIGGGCKLPISAIKSGGYASAEDLVVKLFAKLREACTPKPGLASAAVTAATPPPSQVLR